MRLIKRKIVTIKMIKKIILSYLVKKKKILVTRV